MIHPNGARPIHLIANHQIKDMLNVKVIRRIRDRWTPYLGSLGLSQMRSKVWSNNTFTQVTLEGKEASWIGIAKRNPSDPPNLQVGITIAACRALTAYLIYQKGQRDQRDLDKINKDTDALVNDIEAAKNRLIRRDETNISQSIGREFKF